MSSFCFVHGCLFEGEGGAGSRGGLGAASSHGWHGDPRFSSRSGFLSRSSVATCLQSFARGAVFTQAAGAGKHGVPSYLEITCCGGVSDGHFPTAKLNGRQVPGCCALGCAAGSPGGCGVPATFAKLFVKVDKH